MSLASGLEEINYILNKDFYHSFKNIIQMPTGYKNQEVEVVVAGKSFGNYNGMPLKSENPSHGFNKLEELKAEYPIITRFDVNRFDKEFPEAKPDDTLEKRLIQMEDSIKKLRDEIEKLRNKIELIFGNHIFIDCKPTQIVL